MNLRTVAVALSSSLLAVACSPPPPPPPPAACDLGGATPQTHATAPTASETWASGVHVVTTTLTLRAGVTLTIAPCAEVRFAKDAGLVLRDTAKLVAEGTQTSPITFVRAAAADAWGSILVWTPATASLAWATLEGGGGTTADVTRADYVGASLVARGSAVPLPSTIKVDHVTVKGSTGAGVALIGTRFDAASAGLTITGAGWYPIYLGADATTELPSGSYTGNGLDEILLQTVSVAVYDNARPLMADVVMHDRGVPYRVGTVPASIVVGDGRDTGPNASLTLEAGVTLRFVKEGTSRSQILLNSALRSGTWTPQGALVVTGTASKPVRLTSASAMPAPGDWQGVYFSYTVDPRSHIDNAIIEYAGGDSGSVGVCKASNGAVNSDADCSVIFFLEGDFTGPSPITNWQISNGLGCGFYRGWHGTAFDLTPTNTFTNLAGCMQSNVPNLLNVCPMSNCS